VTGRADLMDAPVVGGLGGTYGGNPLACVAALAVIDVLQRDGLLERGRRLGEIIHRRFLEMQRREAAIGDVRGLGPMIGMELVTDRRAKAPAKETATAVLAGCLQRGLLILRAGVYDNVIRILLPLVITDQDLQRGLDILDEAVAAASGVVGRATV
jgi:4-aminobutyrate aminotransferase/(S)-3-amino-2-methylpropionate transaminase